MLQGDAMIFYTPVFVMVEMAEKNELLSVRCASDDKAVGKVGEVGVDGCGAQWPPSALFS